MSLSGADEISEFASRITYEARENLAKGASQPAASCNFRGDEDDEEKQPRASRIRAHRAAHTMKRNPPRGSSLPKAGVAGVR